jgi:hypothetical protein
LILLHQEERNGPSDIPKRDPNGLLKTHAKGHKKKREDGG